MLSLGPALARITSRLGQDPAYSDLTVTTGLPDIASEIRHQRSQARVTVPLLMVQLALLAVIALALVLGAATEQRAPEIAVAVLRGRGRRGARALLLRELVPVVLVGAVVGFGSAVLLGAVARAALPGRIPSSSAATPCSPSARPCWSSWRRPCSPYAGSRASRSSACSARCPYAVRAGRSARRRRSSWPPRAPSWSPSSAAG